MAARPDSMKPAGCALRRAVLATFCADERSAGLDLSQEILHLGCTWLGLADPPLRAIGPEAPTPEAVASACSELAGQSYVMALAESGFALHPYDAVDLWVVVDLTYGDSGLTLTHNLPRGRTARQEKAQDRELPAGEAAHAAARVVEAAVASVRAHLRIQLIPHLFILAEPAAAQTASVWTESFADLCGQESFIAGPINHAYQRADEWLRHAAAALAIRLWAKLDRPWPQQPPSRTGLWVQAVGGAAWASPVRIVHTWLTLEWERRLLACLCKDSEEATKLDFPSVPSPDDGWRELGATVPGPLSEALHAQRHPGLAQLPTLAGKLIASVQSYADRRLPAQKQARVTWSASQIEVWEHDLGDLRRRMLRPQQTWPQPLRYQHALAHVLRQLRDASRQIEEQLEESAAQEAALDQACARAAGSLQGICDLFPAVTLSSLAGALFRPWRWPRWGLAYLLDLPKAGQSVLDLLVQRQHAAWRTENWLCLRELYLFMTQAVLAAQQDADAIVRQLLALREEVGRQQKSCLSQLLPPWTEDKLACLYADVVGGDAVPTSLLQGRIPLEQWPSSGPSALLEQFQEWIEPDLQSVALWRAPDALVAACPDRDTLVRWCCQFVEHATPLWPAQTILATVEPETWVLAKEALATTDASAGDRRAASIRLPSDPLDLVEQLLQPPADEKHASQEYINRRRVADSFTEGGELAWGQHSADGIFCLTSVFVDLKAAS